MDKDKMKSFLKENWYKILIVIAAIGVVIYIIYAINNPIRKENNVVVDREPETVTVPANNTYIPHYDHSTDAAEETTAEVVTKPIDTSELETYEGGNYKPPVETKESTEVVTESATVIDPITSATIQIPTEAVAVVVPTQPAQVSAELFDQEEKYYPFGSGINSDVIYGNHPNALSTSNDICNQWQAGAISTEECKNMILQIKDGTFDYSKVVAGTLEYDGYGIPSNVTLKMDIHSLDPNQITKTFGYFKVFYDAERNVTTAWYAVAAGA